MTRTVNIEVYYDGTDDSPDLFGVASEHRPDLPSPFDAQLQKWVHNTFTDLSPGDALEEAGEMEYTPNGEIIEFRRK